MYITQTRWVYLGKKIHPCNTRQNLMISTKKNPTTLGHFFQNNSLYESQLLNPSFVVTKNLPNITLNYYVGNIPKMVGQSITSS
jgi:hypothetical protein